MRVTVYHSSYGCDTGCCGHLIETEDSSRTAFIFDHPWYDLTDTEQRKWAEAAIREEFGDDHGYDLDWENCLVSWD